jgi:hypothetical protein
LDGVENAPAVARTGRADRARLYGAIDRLRATTPLALAKVVMTMDSSTGTARDYVAEIKDLGVLGAWDAKSKWDELEELHALATADGEALRRFFVARSAAYVTMRRRRESEIDAQRRRFCLARCFRPVGRQRSACRRGRRGLTCARCAAARRRAGSRRDMRADCVEA